MCGIAGKIYLDGQHPVDPKLIERMKNVIAHRGPDGDGTFLSGPVGLGHRRLSIIDLSSAGAQPMGNEDGKVQIVFNGEIYNYLELRDDLLKCGHAFRSMTDTEVIVHLYEEYGADCLQRLRGMFAFAIWDENNKSLFLARDRVGIKPLYYTITDSALLFGSEIKSLLVDRDVEREVNLPAIDQFLTYFYLPGNETLFKNIYKLEPGHYLLVKNGEVTRKSYWDLRYEPSNRWSNIDEAAEELCSLLRQTVKQHMISDVPVGCLASGGVDSTALLSCAVDETDKTIQTFTIGFAGAHFADEREYARLAAKRFATTHYDMTISAKDFQDFLPRYVWHMEEPVCEPPAIALYYVSKLARDHVAVLLSGEGGDEAFGGYPEYRNLPILERCKTIAGPLRGAAGVVLAQVGRFAALRRAKDLALLMNIPLADYYYSRASSPVSYFNRHRGDLLTDDLTQHSGDRRLCKGFGPMFERTAGTDRLSQMLYVDTKTWLPDKLLIKADKMTMMPQTSPAM